MARFETTVQTFDSVLGADLTLGVLNAQTFALNSFGPEQTGVFQSASGEFSSDDDTITFNGDPVRYVGSGEAQFGIETGGGLGGLLRPITDLVFDTVSDPAPVTVFEAGGQAFVIFLEGRPDTLLGLDSVLIRFDLSADPVVIPCFAAGTLILTPNGEVPIETLEAGDLVTDVDGSVHPIVWTGTRRVHLNIPHPEIRRLCPVRIPRDALGSDLPREDLLVSPQHLILREGADVEIVTGEARAFCAAQQLVGDVAHVVSNLGSVTYHHILCQDHVVLVANGLPCESLRLGHRMIDEVFEDEDAVANAFPDLFKGGARVEMAAAYPVLRTHEVRVL